MNKRIKTNVINRKGIMQQCIGIFVRRFRMKNYQTQTIFKSLVAIVILLVLNCGGSKDEPNFVEQYIKTQFILGIFSPAKSSGFSSSSSSSCTNYSTQACSNSTGIEVKVQIPSSIQSSSYTLEILTPRTSTSRAMMDVSITEEFYSSTRQCIVQVSSGYDTVTKKYVTEAPCKVNPTATSYQVNIITATKYLSSYVSSLTGVNLTNLTLKDIPLSGQKCSISGLDQDPNDPGKCIHPVYGSQRRIYFQSTNFYECLTKYAALRAKYPSLPLDEPSVGTLPETVGCFLDTTKTLVNRLSTMETPTMPTPPGGISTPTGTGTGTGTGSGSSTGTSTGTGIIIRACAYIGASGGCYSTYPYYSTDTGACGTTSSSSSSGGTTTTNNCSTNVSGCAASYYSCSASSTCYPSYSDCANSGTCSGSGSSGGTTSSSSSSSGGSTSSSCSCYCGTYSYTTFNYVYTYNGTFSGFLACQSSCSGSDTSKCN